MPRCLWWMLLLAGCQAGPVASPGSGARACPADDLPRGDCRRCVGSSWVSSLEDVPADDGNPCTEEVCSATGPAHVPSPAGKACGPDRVCSGAGRCGACVPGEARCTPAGRDACDGAGAWQPAASCSGACSAGRCVEVVQLAIGLEHTCALLSDQSVACWGDNQLGHAGVGSAPRVLLSPRAVPISGVAQLAAGPGMHTCARLASGDVMCWGLNDRGQLGLAPTRDVEPLPVVVPGLKNAVDLAVGATHACAVVADGAVWCWGANDSGQLGDGTRTDRSSPVRVVSLPAASRVAAGDRHTCALLRDRTVRCWGSNMFGESGGASHTDYGTNAGRLRVGSDVPSPAVVEALSGAVSLTAGSRQSCALLQDGTVKCWGGDVFHPRPLEVKGLSPVRSVHAAGRYVCALLRSGDAVCWGTNEHGQLGDGTRKNRGKPSPVTGVQQAEQLAAGREHVCVKQHGGEVLCWGSNVSGKLGDGTREARLVPTRVRWNEGEVGP